MSSWVSSRFSGFPPIPKKHAGRHGVYSVLPLSENECVHSAMWWTGFPSSFCPGLRPVIQGPAPDPLQPWPRWNQMNDWKNKLMNGIRQVSCWHIKAIFRHKRNLQLSSSCHISSQIWHYMRFHIKRMFHFWGFLSPTNTVLVSNLDFRDVGHNITSWISLIFLL